MTKNTKKPYKLKDKNKKPIVPKVFNPDAPRPTGEIDVAGDPNQC